MPTITMQSYNTRNDHPWADAPYELTRDYWESRVQHERYHDMLFSGMMGVRGAGSAGKIIVYDASAVQPGGFVQVPMRRPAASDDTPNAYGDVQIVDYGTLSESLVTGMTWANLKVYAGQVRFAHLTRGRESERMVQQYGHMSEIAAFLGERWRQWTEKEIVQAIMVGLSYSVTDANSYPYVTPKTFTRSNVYSTHDLSAMTHPNTLFAAPATNVVATGPYLNVLDNIQTNTSGISLDAIDALRPSIVKRKIAPVSTPYGMKWPVLIHPDVGAALRTNDDFRAAQQGAAPRDYGTNIMWQNAIGTYAGFAFIESQYVTNARTTATGRDRVFPCIILGENALAMSEPVGIRMDTETVDLGNKTFTGASGVYGFARADFFNDAGYGDSIWYSDPDDSGQNVYNTSSAVWYVHAPATGA